MTAEAHKIGLNKPKETISEINQINGKKKFERAESIPINKESIEQKKRRRFYKLG